MNYSIVPAAAPEFELITLAEAKAQCRVDTLFTADDTLINAYIKAAGDAAEAFCNRAFRLRNYNLSRTRFPSGRAPLLLPKGNFRELISIDYRDTDNATAELEPDDVLVTNPAAVVHAMIVPLAGESWPGVSTDYPLPVVINYDAGYALAADVPEDLKTAIKLIVGAFYEFREAQVEGGASEIPLGYRHLLMPYVLGDEFTDYGNET
jgi:uncharacterized phiE125 gp8 family phage protein